MKRLVPLALVAGLSLSLAACGEEAEPCSLKDNGDGTVTVRCDGQSVVVPGGKTGSDCTLVRAEDGSGIISCAEGTVIRLDPDGRPILPGKGTISGSAQYLGLTDHAGILVRAVGTPYTTTTDAQGQYELTDLPAGLYSLSFEGRGRVPARLENLPAVGGIYLAPPVTLRLGMQISTEALNWLIVAESPRKDTLLVAEGPGAARLAIWDIDRKLGTVLSATATGPGYASDGRYVVFLEDRSRDGKVVLWDVDARHAETIFDGASQATFLEDGRTVLVHAESLVLVDVETKEAVVIPDSRPAPVEAWAAPDGKTVAWARADGQVAFWDVEERRATHLSIFVSPVGPAGSPVVFTPDGRDALIGGRDPSGSNVLFHQDLRGGVGKTLANSESPIQLRLPVTDRYAAFQANIDGTVSTLLWVRAGSGPRLLGTDLFAFPALGDTALLLWRLDSESRDLSLYDVGSGAKTPLASQVRAVHPSPDGRTVLVETDEEGDAGWKLVGLPGREHTPVGGISDFDWSKDGAWLRVTANGSTKLFRASTGRVVDLGTVEARGFTARGLFFLVREEEDDFFKTFLGLWDLDRGEADILGLYPGDGTFHASNTGRTVFLSESTGLWKVVPRTGARELIDAEVVPGALVIRDGFLLYGTTRGTWMITSFE